MPSLITQMIIAERYGPRLNTDQLAECLGLSKGGVYNQISAGTFPVATYVDGGKRWADFRDVASHLDNCREQARVAA
jgi:predicted DNA-binding transcriptional regulator AlpA